MVYASRANYLWHCAKTKKRGSPDNPPRMSRVAQNYLSACGKARKLNEGREASSQEEENLELKPTKSENGSLRELIFAKTEGRKRIAL